MQGAKPACKAQREHAKSMESNAEPCRAASRAMQSPSRAIQSRAELLAGVQMMPRATQGSRAAVGAAGGLQGRRGRFAQWGAKVAGQSQSLLSLQLGAAVQVGGEGKGVRKWGGAKRGGGLQKGSGIARGGGCRKGGCKEGGLQKGVWKWDKGGKEGRVEERGGR